jgi:UDP-GlcNAc:undecaprenyl-phosphate/decaprenyl-phosphate GlcNAc-1-phosphate transferase
MRDILGFLLALGLTAAAIPMLARAARGWGLLAHPDLRRTHEGAVPVIGGLAMGAAFLAAYALTGLAASLSLLLAAAVAITLAGGVLDDRHEVGSLPKFGFQIAAAALLVYGGDVVLTHLGHLMSTQLFSLGRWSAPLTVFALVGVMNAMNMADGLDGLAGALALAACVNFGVAASLAGHAPEFAVICITTGAAVAFLYFNARSPWRRQAAVFMGDTGSLLLGLLLGWFAVRLAMAEPPALAPISAVWILALPIGDTVTLLVRRALRGRSPFHADRQHLHHILLALGLSSGQTVGLLLVLSFALGAAALAAEALNVPEYAMFYAYMTCLVAYGFAAEIACKRLGLRKSGSEPDFES